jgi:hypothetical protein
MYNAQSKWQGNSSTVTLNLTAEHTIKVTITFNTAATSIACVARLMHGYKVDAGD